MQLGHARARIVLQAKFNKLTCVFSTLTGSVGGWVFEVDVTRGVPFQPLQELVCVCGENVL